MIITLTGVNSFLLRAELDRLMSTFEAVHGTIGLERLDGESASFERLQESLQSPPFLSDRKMVVLRAPGINKRFVESFDALFRDLPETTDVIIIEPKLDKRAGYYKTLKKISDFRESIEPNEAAMISWLVDRAKANGGSIAQSEARLLVERSGNNQQVLSGELEKLLLYDSVITQETIKLLIEPTPQSTVFELLEAAFRGDVTSALQLYQEQREQKVDTAQIIAMFTWQLRVLALIKSVHSHSTQAISSMTKLSPFVIQKSQTVARRLDMGRLRQLICDLVAIDVRSKRERIDTDEALQNFLLALAS